TPRGIAGAGAAEVTVGDLVKPACAVKGRSTLISDALVVDEAACARQLDRLFVQAHRVKVTAFDPCNFGADQRGAVFEIFLAILRPSFELSVMCSQSFQMLRGIVGAYGVAGCSTRERAVKVIFGLLNKAGRDPEQLLRSC